MAVTYLNLVGAREAPDKTIRALLQNNWNAANTLSKTPTFQSDTEEPDVIAGEDYTDENQVAVRWLSTQRDESANEPNGDTIHHWFHRLAIGTWGETMPMSLLINDEVNRIIWQFRPSNNTVLNKSDATASEADYFEKTEIDFERIAPASLIDNKPSFEGILEIHFRKLRT